MTETSDTEAAAPASRKPWTSTIAPRVFWPSAIIIVGFVLFTVLFPTAVGDAISALQETVVGTFSWYYMLIVSGFVLFSLWIGLSHYGDIKLGPDEEPPEFGMKTWFSMLFAAGMGIGLVFWGVAEPLNHFAGIPNRATGIEAGTEEGAHQSILQTFLHWGLHPWAIYVVVGVAVAYAIHRKKRPVSIRYALESLLGRRVKGWVGDIIDIAAIVGTLFGVATSLGLGVMQVASGLEFLDIVSDPDNVTYAVLIGAITTLAIVSVVSGLKRGIKWLSNINMSLAAALLLFVLIAGPTLFIFRDIVQNIGDYFQNLLSMSFNTTAYAGEDGSAWQGSWTTFYWGWWISWAPFVGVFIARISRGRTVREFVAGVLLVPSAVTFLWFTVFGGTALHRELFGGGGLIGTDETGAATVDTNGALFGLLGEMPAGTFVVVGAIILIVLFFVTSSDSGSLVVDMLASGGDPNPPVWSRVFWGLMEGAVAVALLLAGGLNALQLVAILIALPFSVVMIGMCISTWKAFRSERATALRIQRRLQRDALTEHISQNLIDEGLVEPGNDNGSSDPDEQGGKDKKDKVPTG
ncbi:choline transporter [Prauserella marina]|uniref:Choline/glycine/proline betaine transport protein n=1 Tax=Prauserella marina TaxID=530584 RepID=A0A222VXX9_9PSEU|nr:BCCT family transporter [Prauserella marina]ASR38836.1 choline transporter [Prauserella marina]PWV82299.1 choline/glycine/proline betaine transport protein [Prauserella marina]SDC65659.1 choline/glycine/proline betaine transport protein [Prauserella marina]